MNLGDLRARVREVMLEQSGSNLSSRLADVTTTGVTAINDWINAAYEDLVVETIELNPTYFCVASDVTYAANALSLDLAGAGTPPMPGAAFRILGIDDVTNTDHEGQIRAGGFPERWNSEETHWNFMTSTQIRLRGRPLTAVTLRVYWVNPPPRLTADNDEPRFHPLLHWAIVYRAAVLISEPALDVSALLAARDQHWSRRFTNYMTLRQSQEAERMVPRTD